MKTPLKVRVQPYLEDLRTRKLTVKALAAELDVGYTYLSRLLHQLGHRAEPGQRQRNRQLRQARQEYREQVARTEPIHKAAQLAHCHPRTIRRVLAKLKGQ